jgi:homoserine dehydrogenase
LDATGGLKASLRFERRDHDALFVGATEEANAIRIRLADGRTLERRGKGAGRKPTVESILGDLGAIRALRQATPPKCVAVAKEALSA